MFLSYGHHRATLNPKKPETIPNPRRGRAWEIPLGASGRLGLRVCRAREALQFGVFGVMVQVLGLGVRD